MNNKSSTSSPEKNPNGIVVTFVDMKMNFIKTKYVLILLIGAICLFGLWFYFNSTETCYIRDSKSININNAIIARHIGPQDKPLPDFRFHKSGQKSIECTQSDTGYEYIIKIPFEAYAEIQTLLLESNGEQEKKPSNSHGSYLFEIYVSGKITDTIKLSPQNSMSVFSKIKDTLKESDEVFDILTSLLQRVPTK